MFSFFRKKNNKQAPDEECKNKFTADRKKICADDAKASDNKRNSSQTEDGHCPEILGNQTKAERCSDQAISRNRDANELTSNITDSILQSVNRTCDNSSDVIPNPHPSSQKYCAGIVPNGTRASEVINTTENIHENYSDNAVLRRNSKTSKEVVNLLLPEDSVKYKKDTSYLSKTGVQNLLDKMGRGKNKYKNDKKKNRSWSFGGNKLKNEQLENDNYANKRSSMDNAKEFNYVSNSNVFTNISDDLSYVGNSNGQAGSGNSIDNTEILNINASDGEPDGRREHNDIMQSIRTDFEQKYLADRIDVSSSSSTDLINPSAKSSSATPVGVPRADDTSTRAARGGKDCEALTSSDGKCAKQATGEGGRWYFGTEEDQYDAKRDTTRSPVPPFSEPIDHLKKSQDVQERIHLKAAATNDTDPKPSVTYVDCSEVSDTTLDARDDESSAITASDVVASDKGEDDRYEDCLNDTTALLYHGDSNTSDTSSVDALSAAEKDKTPSMNICDRVSNDSINNNLDNTLIPIKSGGISSIASKDYEDVEDLIKRITSKVKQLKDIKHFEDKLQMGATDSKQNVKRDDKLENDAFESAQNVNNDLPPSYYVRKKSIDSEEQNKINMNISPKLETSEPTDEKVNKLQDLMFVVENNSHADVLSELDLEESKDTEDKPVIKGSLSLEIMNMETKVTNTETIQLIPGMNGVNNKETSIKNILKEEKDADKQSAVKKHVTFQNFIEFDDGDRVEDDLCEDESFASLDDNEEISSVVQMELDNDENLITDDEHNEIIEFDESSSLSEDIVILPHMKKDVLIIEELEVENDECAGLEGDSDEMTIPCVVEEHSDKQVELLILQPDEELMCIDEKITEDTEESISESVESEESDEIIEEEEEEVGEEVEEEEEVEDEESSEEDTSSEELHIKNENNNKINAVVVNCEQCKNNDDDLQCSDIKNVNTNRMIIEKMRYQYQLEEKEEETAYSDLLRLLEKQMRGLVGQDERLADLQDRAAALHRVQGEVSSARKEAELVRQKLWHVEADLAATRCRNSQLLEHLEARTEEAKEAESKIKDLTEKAAHLQELLDKLIPENEQLKEKYQILKTERDEERKIIEETLFQAEEERTSREEWWREEFEKLRSQGAEREELLLADCEWKLREVQQAARDKGAVAEQRLRDIQRQADERCARADSQLAEVAELRSLQAEITQLRQAAREQQRALRLAGERASHAAQAESEAARLRALLDREKGVLGAARAQHAKELEEKENRLIARLQEQAVRLEREWKTQQATEEQERRVREQQESCKVHENMIKEAYDRLEILKSTLARKESQYQETLERTKTRTDWEMLELRRLLDKTEIKYAEAIEHLEEKHAAETEQINNEMERKIKDLEITLGSQVVSARTTLELVKGQLQADYADHLLRLKEKYKTEMEKQWEVFTNDKEECLERMKAECIQEGQEDKEKREKDLLKDIEVLKSELAAQEKDLNALRNEARKSTDAKIIAEKRLSEVQTACETRELGVRAEVSRQAEVAQREARETIDHLTKKCACLTNLFEDMRSRWQQAPGEAAQLRKALQDEKAKSAALRRQLDALSRYHQGDNRALAMIEKLLPQEEINAVRKSPESNADTIDEEPKTNTQSSPIAVSNDTHDENGVEESGFIKVKYSGRKRKKKRPVSPPRPPVYLPAVTVPVRIKQFNMNCKKNDVN